MFEQMEFFHNLSTIDTPLLLLLSPLILALYFLPVIVATCCNRKHLGKIALANIPAGLSFLAWGALLVWAFTGKQKTAIKPAEAQDCK